MGYLATACLTANAQSHLGPYFIFLLMIFEVFPYLQCAFHLIIMVFVCCYPSLIESLCDVLQKLKPVYILLNKTIPHKQQIPSPHHISSFLSLQSCSSATENQTNMKMISVAFTTGLSIDLSFISFLMNNLVALREERRPDLHKRRTYIHFSGEIFLI